MKDSKEHLDIDLEFLDKKEPIRVAPKPESNTRQTSNTPKAPSKVTTYNWKNILIISGVILFIGWAIFSSDDGSSSSSTNTYIPPTQTSNYNTNNDNVMIGEYSCSRSHYNQAVTLNPDETEQQIENASNAFEYRANALERLEDEINSSYVDEYSTQWEIDDYNAKVNEYNSKLPAYERDLVSLEARINTYNAQIQRHNNYLAANCTKKY